MRRTKTETRRPTVDDLSPFQRHFYDSLLNQEQREEFLKFLPDIRERIEAGKAATQSLASKKLESIEKRRTVISDLITALEDQRGRLHAATMDLKRGKDPTDIDLRSLLGPPAVEGVELRFMRSKHAE